jgi:O-antigen/teichoic acid export membrane protein/O-antigen ligase
MNTRNLLPANLVDPEYADPYATEPVIDFRRPQRAGHEGVAARRIAFDVAHTLATSGIYQFALLGAAILIARMLGVNGRGAVGSAVLVPTIVAYAGELGLPVATGHALSTRPGDRETVIGTARASALGLSMVLVPLSLILTLVLPVGDGVRLPALIFAAFIPLNILQRVHLAVLQADLRMKAFNAVRLSGATLYIGIVAALFATHDGSVDAVVWALLVGNALWFAMSAVLVGRGSWLSFDRETARTLFGYGLRAHPGNVSSVDTLRLDQLVLALFLSPYDLGLYLAAMTFVTANRMIGTSIGMVAFPVAMRKQSATRRMIMRLLAVTAALSILVALIEMAAGDRLLRVLFGRDFGAAYPALVVLAGASILMNLRQVLADWLRGDGQPVLASVSEAVLLVALTISATLLLDQGVKGVAWAVAIASLAGLGTLTIVAVLPYTSGDLLALAQAAHLRLVLVVTLLSCAIGGLASIFLPPEGRLLLAAVLVIGILGALLIHRHGVQAVTSLMCLAAGSTLAANGIRLTSSVTVSDVFLVATGLSLLPQLTKIRTQLLSIIPLHFAGAGLIIVGGLVAEFANSGGVDGVANIIRFTASIVILPMILILWAPSIANIFRMAWLWVLSASVSAIVAILNNPGNGFRPTGLTTHSNHLALVSLLALPIAVSLMLHSRPSGRLLAAFCILTLAAGIGVSGSRAAILGSLVLVPWFVAFSRHRLSILFVTIVLAGAATLVFVGFIGIDSVPALSRLLGQGGQSTAISDAARQAALQNAFDLLTKHPITGVDFEHARAAHNVPLQVWLSGGLLGLFGLMMIVISHFRLAARCLVFGKTDAGNRMSELIVGLMAAFAAYIVAGLFQPPLWDRYIWLIPSLLAVCALHALPATISQRWHPQSVIQPQSSFPLHLNDGSSPFTENPS